MKKPFLLLCCCLLLIAVPVQAGEATETAADVLRVLLPAAAYGLTFLHDDPEGRSQFYQSFFSTVGATYLLKIAVDAERPNGGGRSFPSGHASMAYSGAIFMQQRYGWLYGLPAWPPHSSVGAGSIQVITGWGTCWPGRRSGPRLPTSSPTALTFTTGS